MMSSLRSSVLSVCLPILRRVTWCTLLYRLLLDIVKTLVTASQGRRNTTYTSQEGHLRGPASVQCGADGLGLHVPTEGVLAVKLDKWAVMPGCRFRRGDTHFSIQLSLSSDLPCGTTRVTNTITGKSLYYQRLRIYNDDGSEERLLVKCSPSNDNSTLHNIVRRDLPPEFVEPDYIEITSEVSGTAPVPILGVGVRQDGSLVEGAINVAPGTPLTMEVFLDSGSAGTYGILVSYLEVTDSADKRETIVYNGCTIDPNLFENFGTNKGDFLSAKFRAFKFPESNYVLFRGTVDVCLDKCQGITCSDGKVGYGRRRRDLDSRQADPNKLFEVTMTTFIKFSENSTDGGFHETADIFAEEIVREKLPGSRLSSSGWEAPLTRRSPDTPPSIVFNGAPSLSTLSLTALSVGYLALLRQALW